MNEDLLRIRSCCNRFTKMSLDACASNDIFVTADFRAGRFNFAAARDGRCYAVWLEYIWVKEKWLIVQECVLDCLLGVFLNGGAKEKSIWNPTHQSYSLDMPKVRRNSSLLTICGLS